MIYCAYDFNKELIKDINPLYSALILSTTFLWINYAHMATQDIVFLISINRVNIYNKSL